VRVSALTETGPVRQPLPSTDRGPGELSIRRGPSIEMDQEQGASHDEIFVSPQEGHSLPLPSVGIRCSDQRPRSFREEWLSEPQ
jgi:hypothetical protein